MEGGGYEWQPTQIWLTVWTKVQALDMGATPTILHQFRSPTSLQIQPSTADTTACCEEYCEQLFGYEECVSAFLLLVFVHSRDVLVVSDSNVGVRNVGMATTHCIQTLPYNINWHGLYRERFNA
jgi:hypothetical protein